MKRFPLIPLIVLLFGGSAFAQSHTSAKVNEPTMILTGAVYDINGAVIVTGVEVVASDSAGRKYESATSDEGYYKFELPLAVYKIEVSAPGFCPARVERFKVVSATHGKMSLDFVLDVRAPDSCSNGHETLIPDNPKPKGKSKLKPVAE